MDFAVRKVLDPELKFPTRKSKARAARKPRSRKECMLLVVTSVQTKNS